MGLRFRLLEPYPDLRYGLSEKSDGSMKLFGDLSIDRAAQEKRQAYFKKEGVSFRNIISGAVVHGTKVETVTEEDKGKIFPETDGLMTRDPNIFLSVTVADCFPVYFYEPQSGIVGIAHAGWKGILAGVVPATVARLTSAGAKPENLLTVIGPGIQKHHFEIKDDIVSPFAPYSDLLERREEKIFVDLPAIVRTQLIKSGVAEKNTELSDVCTYCASDAYFSYRRDKPKVVEAMVAYIGLK